MSRKTSTAIVMVTNLAGLSRTANDLDDDDLALLHDHDMLVRKELAGHGSSTIEELDDGFLGIFPSQTANPLRIVACGLRLVQQLDEIGLTVRIGLDAGEVSLTRKGIRGSAIEKATEVMHNAAPGEVLVSGEFRRLIKMSGQRFTDLGEQDLDGAGAVHLFRAEAATGPRFGP